MQWHIALHMHDDITLNGCECMIGKSTLCLVFDWVGLVNGITCNRVTRLNKMVKKMCVTIRKIGIRDGHLSVSKYR